MMRALAVGVILAMATGVGYAETEVQSAIAVLQSVGDSGVSGTVHFEKDGDSIRVHGTVKGLSPGKHGFHVHQYGNLSDMEAGTSAGGHFNPAGKPHGNRTDAERHVGDLGNIEADENGMAQIDFTDSVIQLNGPNSIVGRAVVVHEKEDTFVQPTGAAGARVAIGVIGLDGNE